MGVTTSQTLWMTPDASVVDEVWLSAGSSTSVPEPLERCATTPDSALLESSVSVRPPLLVCAPGLTTVTESVAAIASPGGQARAEIRTSAAVTSKARTGVFGRLDHGIRDSSEAEQPRRS